MLVRKRKFREEGGCCKGFDQVRERAEAQGSPGLYPRQLFQNVEEKREMNQLTGTPGSGKEHRKGRAGRKKFQHIILGEGIVRKTLPGRERDVMKISCLILLSRSKKKKTTKKKRIQEVTLFQRRILQRQIKNAILAALFQSGDARKGDSLKVKKGVERPKKKFSPRANPLIRKARGKRHHGDRYPSTLRAVAYRESSMGRSCFDLFRSDPFTEKEKTRGNSSPGFPSG